MHPFDQEGLLTLAHKVHAAAAGADPERLKQAARHFREALAEHLGNEAAALIHLSPAEVRILRRGQVRLAAAADALSEDASRGCSDSPPTCASRAQELLVLLALQARDERSALYEPAA